MALRKSDFKDHPMECPHCGTKLIIASPMDVIIAARRTLSRVQEGIHDRRWEASRREEAAALHARLSYYG